MKRTLSPTQYRRLTAVAVAFQILIIVTGATVRLTGSGLGCTDWPGCEGERFVAPLQFHSMVEFVNRLITAPVSLSILAVVVGAVLRRPYRRDLLALALGLVAGVVGQIVLGRFTVESDLAPGFVMSHFLLSLVMVANAVVLHERAGRHGGAPVALVGRRAHALLVAQLPLLAAAVVAGAVLTGTGPHGGDEDARRFGFAIESVARAHSLLVIAFLLVLLGALGQLGREGAPAVVQQRAQQLLGIAVAQAGVGWVQYFTGVPVLLVLVHILGAALVWGASCRLVLSARTVPADAPDERPVLVGQTS